MKISLAWLRQWIDAKLDEATLASKLTFLGLEVDNQRHAAPPFSGVVVGEILSVRSHPKADRLNVCQVRVAANADPLTIVCGASNVRAGLRVAVAKLGATLPTLSPSEADNTSNGQVIQAVELRGQASRGMICSASELGLSETRSAGILALADDAPVGQDIRTYLDLDDTVFDLSITPNRGDCLSVLGIAREVAAYDDVPLLKRGTLDIPMTTRNRPLLQQVQQEAKGQDQVSVQAKQACWHYATCSIDGMDWRASKMPFYQRDLLRRSGVRPLGTIVDLAQYVMLEIGQPFHLFDRAKLIFPLVVRYAKAGESITLLNEQTLHLTARDLVIADQKGAQALAGVMGGKESAVSETTRDVVLECAVFNPSVITETVQRYQLHSESSHRFERGVDVDQAPLAVAYLTQNIVSICGGVAGPVVEAVVDAPAKIADIVLRYAQIERLLGIKLKRSDIVDRLERLGMQLKAKERDAWAVTPPSYRFDVTCEADCIEEIIRLWGYANIPTRIPRMQLTEKRMDQEETNVWNRAGQLLVDRGYREVISYSFVAPNQLHHDDPTVRPVYLRNPLSEDKSVMRTQLWPSLLSIIQYNQHRQQSDLSIFETAYCYRWGEGQTIVQQRHLAALISGTCYLSTWGAAWRESDFFDIKGDVEAILDAIGLLGVTFVSGTHRALHSGQNAVMMRGGKAIGLLGRLHPRLVSQQSLRKPVFLFELYDLGRLSGVKQFRPMSRFPKILRDVCLGMTSVVSQADVQVHMRRVLGDILQSVHLVDVYEGDANEQARKWFTFRLMFQHESRTLTDEEVNKVMASLLDTLVSTYHIKLRTIDHVDHKKSLG